VPKIQKGDERTPGSGRIKGTPNKFTVEFRHVLAEVLFADPKKTRKKLIELRDSRDSADRATFWRLAGKMLPQLHEVKNEFDELPLVTFNFAGRAIDGGKKTDK